MPREEKSAPLLQEIAAAFAALPEVEAVALAGSSVGDYGDEYSDYDFYVYSRREVDPRKRREIAQRYATAFNIDNHFYETDDEWLLAESGRQVEFIYRSCDWIEEAVERVWARGGASVGYSTCFIYNVRNSVVHHDPNSWFRRLRAATASPYPRTLRTNIIAKNVPMLYGRLNGSFHEQIINAIARNDDICLNHRIAAFLASYFDVIFAVNEVLYPGEKRLLRYALDTCRRLPASLEGETRALIRCPNTEKTGHLERLVKELKALVHSQLSNRR